MREPANKRLITDVSGLAPTVARSSQKQLLTRFWRGSLVACPRVDNGHKSIADWRASGQGSAHRNILARLMTASSQQRLLPQRNRAVRCTPMSRLAPSLKDHCVSLGSLVAATTGLPRTTPL